MSRNFLIIFFLLLIGCNTPVEPPKKEINKNILELKRPNLEEDYNDIYGKIAIYRNGDIYTGPYLSKTKIDLNNNVLEFKYLKKIFQYDNWLYIDGNEDGTKLLLVRSRFNDICAGSLFEYNTLTEEFTQLIDSTNYVSSARYLKGDYKNLIYYKYGSLDYNGAGYYLFDLVKKEEKMIFSYVSGPGLSEMVNVFDIYPSNKKLLLCLTQGIRFEGKPPFIGIYDIEMKSLDTLKINFENIERRTSLWLRYNIDGSKILYSYFPRGSYSYTTNGTSEAGIIDVATLNKKILDIDTRNENQVGSVQLSVEWDKNEQRIVFCSGPVLIDGALGKSKLYVLKQIP